MLKDFQKFIMRGNVVDLAVGVIIGAAFTGIVNSLVTDIIMPPIGVILGGIDFSDFFLPLSLNAQHVNTIQAAKAAGIATLNYGLFLNAVIKFLIVAFSVFLMIRGLNKLMVRFKKEEAAAAEPSSTDKLLMEIRDALKK